ncbi:MAG: DUF1365 domain-containing protein [Gammaproteobacteria bacterium]|nr:DUF1365 domain-containing protein [Gammaproteobacteria bacterium]
MSRQNSVTLESALYQGVVRHRRFTPKRHEFEYPLFMFLIKAREIPTVLSRFWQLGSSALSLARLRRQDYIGPADRSIEHSVIEKIAELGELSCKELTGEVFMLVQLRYFGFYFSPLNVYYLRQAGKFRYMLAEVSNTPWNERHYYLQDLSAVSSHDKSFHVSPFNPMTQQYRWKILPPSTEHGQCCIHLQCHDREQAELPKVFDATMTLSRRELNQAELRSVLLRTPAQTVAVLAGIYWQALKLFLKGTPLFKHPRKLVEKPDSATKTEEGTA